MTSWSSAALVRFLFLCSRLTAFLDFGVDAFKGGGSRVLSCATMKIRRMPVSIDLAEVSCSGRLCRRASLGTLKGALRSSADCYYRVARFLVSW
jgi:hypothetical protein